MRKIFIVLLLPLLVSCVSQVKYEKLLEENGILEKEIESLSKKLEAYQNDPTKLLQEMKDAFESGNKEKMEEIKNNIVKYHPQSTQRKVIDSIMTAYNKKEKEIEDEKIKKEKLEKDKKLASLHKLKKEHDDVSGITWYKNPYFTHYADKNLFSICIGTDQSSIWLTMLMSYTGDDWIFFKNAYLSYDGTTLEIPFDEYSDKKTDNNGYGVWEWIQLRVDETSLAFLREMANGKQPKMRLAGKYTKTRNLTPNEIKGIQDILAGYDVLCEEMK